jgi:hypothetical protein
VLRAHQTADAEVLRALVSRVEERVVFVDEIAKLPGYRGSGIESVLRLVWPVVLSVARERVGVLCWSGKGSRI